MEDGVGARGGEDRAHGGGVADVGLVKADARRQRARQVLAPARGEVVDGRDLGARLQQPVDYVRADEAGGSGDDRPRRHAGRAP